MFHSLRIPNIILRIGLAVVFMWFGVHKFIAPAYWVDTWLPQNIQGLIATIGMTPRDVIFLNGIFEVLVAVSLLSGYFIRIFATLAALFLIPVIAVHLSTWEIVIRDAGLLGGLLALATWPERIQW